jgi:hypothetical protein
MRARASTSSPDATVDKADSSPVHVSSTSSSDDGTSEEGSTSAATSLGASAKDASSEDTAGSDSPDSGDHGDAASSSKRHKPEHKDAQRPVTDQRYFELISTLSVGHQGLSVFSHPLNALADS